MITKRTLGCFLSPCVLYFVLFSMNLVYADFLPLTSHYTASSHLLFVSQILFRDNCPTLVVREPRGERWE